MTNPQFSAADNTADVQYSEMDALDDVDGIDEVEQSSPRRGGKASAECAARRQLEERREAQHLRRLLSDYAWDEKDF
jgi:hypothetical protein